MIPTEVLLYAVGDLGFSRDRHESVLGATAPTLKKADILFDPFPLIAERR